MLISGIIIAIILVLSLILCFPNSQKTSLENEKKTINYIKKYRVRILGGSGIKLVGTIMDLVLPYILAYIIDEIVPNKELKMVVLYGFLMIGCAILGFLATVIANQLASKVAEFVTIDLRKDLFEKIQSLSASQLDEVTIPSLVSRMTSDTYNIHHVTGLMQRLGTRAPILFIGGLIMTVILDPVMTLVLISILPLIIITIYVTSKVGIPLFSNVQESVDDVVKSIRESATGIRVIKALSKEEYEKNKFEKVNKKLINYELKSGIEMAKINPITTALLNFGLIGVIVVGAYRVNYGYILPGKVLAFTTYFTIILNAMLSITRVFLILTKAIASGKRIDYVFRLKQDLLLEESEKMDSPYHIEFRNVSFSYNKKINNVNKINFKIKHGESLGIIGATGSGKTTLIKLLMRFYDVTEGEILIDGRNIKSIPLDELKSMFGVVFQNDTIFSKSIKENICFGRNFTDEEIDTAIRISQAKEFIDKIPEGLDKELSAKGTNVSGGQRQRILIARAVISNPEILILDDASSALDYKTDAALRKEIRENLNHTTSIIVTQRVSSVSYCEQILVLSDGEEVGIGNHETLLKSVPLYKEIYDIQMGGEMNE
ncbi:MAG: ABC transporter ATP-binding protein [Bacilli bacterium]|nr:ABC transporter ATP-binding protein [Bacilli bacterium]